MNMEPLGNVTFNGKILGDLDISGLAVVGDFLVICSDETASVQVLKKDGVNYTVLHDLILDPSGKEVDLEGVAAEGNIVYVTGSHSRVRKENETAPGVLSILDDKKHREQFFRFTLDAAGKPGRVETKSLKKALDKDPILKDFIPIASKENGIDIEGLAVKKGVLYFGFRGPVLRDNWVPILTCTFDDPTATAKTVYVNLDGRGIRDIVATADGFLILAGPVGNGHMTYRIYYWDGHDLWSKTAPGQMKRLADVPPMGKGKPEGLTVLKHVGNEYELLLVCDGVKNGAPTRWKLKR